MGHGEASQSEPEAFLDALIGHAIPASLEDPDPVVPIFEAASIAAAVVDRHGAIVCACSAFRAFGVERFVDMELLTQIAEGARPAMALVEVEASDGAPDTAVFAYGQARDALAWRLPAEVQQTALALPDHVVVLTSHVAVAGRMLEAACRAYGLSGLQTRVALETIRTANVKAATKNLGLSHYTVRETLAEVMRRIRAPRLPAMVQRLTSLAFGVLPEGDIGDMLTDVWGLSPRQASIAGLVASGFTRGEAARTLALGEAVVKKELDQVYQVLQVSSATGLARKIVEANALHWLTRATSGDIGFMGGGAEPLQFVHRPDETRIAVSDYGPVSGRPVLVVHSSLSTRPVSRSLIRALHKAGYRPISIDRPGFGMSDEVAGLEAGRHDPYAAAAADTVRVLDRLKIKDADVVARGAVKFVLALHAAAPARIGRAVLVNPGLHAAADRRSDGFFGMLKEAYRRNPAMIRLWITHVARHMTYDRHNRLVHQWVRGSAPDEAAVENAEIAHDYFISQRMFATGRVAGYVNEHTEYLRGQPLAPVARTSHWQVLLAAHDMLHEPSDVLAYWRAVLPDARFRTVDDAGRLLAMSHPHYVVEALQAPA